jgi:hypothetical protein
MSDFSAFIAASALASHSSAIGSPEAEGVGVIDVGTSGATNEGGV